MSSRADRNSGTFHSAKADATPRTCAAASEPDACEAKSLTAAALVGHESAQGHSLRNTRGESSSNRLPASLTSYSYSSFTPPMYMAML